MIGNEPGKRFDVLTRLCYALRALPPTNAIRSEGGKRRIIRERTNRRTDERTNGRTSKEARHGALVHVRKRMRVTVVGYVTYGRPWTRTLFRGRKVAWEEKRAGGRERYEEAEVRGTEKERRWRAGRKS